MKFSSRYKRMILWSTTLLLSFSFLDGNSQQYSVIKINVAGAATNRLGISMEHSFLKRMSAQIMFESGLYAHLDDTPAGGDNYKVSGYSIVPEIRFYPFRGMTKSPDGLFVGVSFRYLRFTEEARPKFSTVTLLNIGSLTNLGLDLGYKYSIRSFWIEALVGYGPKGVLSYDYPANANFIPHFYSNDVFLKDVNNFLRTELSIGYMLIQK